ncbi:MAG TPA: hypothetical protein PK784_05630 [Tenuifilaceae bacterium]|nr:hypothetical protein [Tenuifilaceae bacterium]HPN21724.1 hypothetical protein [Tenuifilaceae bacterium]
MKDENYNIVWLSYTADSMYGIKFRAQKDFSLPWIISNSDESENQLKALPEYQLLVGILLGYSPNRMDENLDKPMVMLALEYLAKFFKFKSFESFLLDSSCLIGADYGYTAKMKSLLLSSFLLKDSSKIKSDLIIAIWCHLDTIPEHDFDLAYFNTIYTTLTEVDFFEIKEEAIPIMIISDFLVCKFLKRKSATGNSFETVVALMEGNSDFIEGLHQIRDELVTSPIVAVNFMISYFIEFSKNK